MGNKDAKEIGQGYIVQPSQGNLRAFAVADVDYRTYYEISQFNQKLLCSIFARTHRPGTSLIPFSDALCLVSTETPTTACLAGINFANKADSVE